MNKIQNTLGAVALSLGIATSSAYSQDTTKVVNTTSSAVVAATTSNSGNAGKITQKSLVTPKIDISALVFPKDVKILTDEATKLGLKFETIDDKKKFGSLQENVNIAQMAQNVSREKIENFEKQVEQLPLAPAREELEKMIQDLNSAGIKFSFDFGEKPSKLKLASCKKRIQIVLLDLGSAKIKEESAKIQADIAKIDQNIAKTQAERAKIQAENKKIEQEIREILINLPNKKKE
jgi:F0F1-type ATP synthase epsilon subunit